MFNIKKYCIYYIMIKRLFSSINKLPITITNNAWNKMTEIIKKKNAASFLFSVVSGGCNGFNYDLKLLDKEKYKQVYDTFSNRGKIKPTIISFIVWFIELFRNVLQLIGVAT